jgi:hypothetical protein
VRELLTGEPGCDSFELTEWLAWYEARREREDYARRVAEQESSLQEYVNGG